MVATVHIGRTPHETVELHPDDLDCGHPWMAGRVPVGYDAHPDGGRQRTWTCKEDWVVTWDVRP